jgi:hypothetical protein
LKTWGYDGPYGGMVDKLHAFYVYKRMWAKTLRKNGVSNAQIRAQRYARIVKELLGKKERVGGGEITRPSRIYKMKIASDLIIRWRKVSSKRLLTEAEKDEIKDIEQEGGGPASREKVEEVRKRRETRVHGVQPGVKSVYAERSRIVNTMYKVLQVRGKEGIERETKKGVAAKYEDKINTIINAKIKKKLSSRAAKKLKKAIKELMGPAKAPKKGGMTTLTWFYFGDLIDAALDIIRSGAEGEIGLDIWRAPVYDAKGKIDPAFTRGGTVKVVLGDVTYFDPVSGRRATISLMDLPISYELFKEFWAKKVINDMREHYSFKRFLSDAMNELVAAALTNKCALAGEPVVGIRSHIVHTSIAKDAVRKVYAVRPVGDFVTSDPDERGADRVWRAQIWGEGKEPMMETDPAIQRHRNPSAGSTNINRMPPGHDAGKSIFDSIMHSGEDNKPGAKHKEQEIIFLCATTDKAVSLLSGDKTIDVKNGILYLEIGTDGTPIERISFAKQDMPWYLEAKGERSGFKDDPIELSEAYRCDFSIYGNTMIKPGQYIHIRLPHFGLPSTPHSPARRLGLGGYFFITKVRNSLVLRGNKFDWITDANCIWNSFGVEQGSDRGHYITTY